jgi:alanine dehydrogenase
VKLKVLLLSRQEVEKLASMREVIEAVEGAFKAKGEGKAQMPPKLYVFFKKYDGDFRTMPAYLENLDAAGVKVVNVHPRNPEEKGLPSVMATIMLLDPKTGAPIAIMDGTWITDMRTGASGGIATKYLARKDSEVVALVGAGAQARTQLMALKEVLNIKEVRIWSRRMETAKKLEEEAKKSLGLKAISVKTVKEAVSGADVISTTTPSRGPVVMDEWISPGAHINAIGADAPGKQELDPKILKRAKIVVDDREQAFHSGEVNVPLSKGIIKESDVYADMGEIVTGRKKGRASDKEITIFDSTGLAVQDIATAWMIYQKAKNKGVGREVELI